MLRGPVKVYEISDMRDNGKAVEVFVPGINAWKRFPKSQVDFEFHRIIVPEWLARKIMYEKPVPELS